MNTMDCAIPARHPVQNRSLTIDGSNLALKPEACAGGSMSYEVGL